MKRRLFKLYASLSAPVPMPKSDIGMAGITWLSFAALAPFDSWLSTLGLSALMLSLVLGITTRTFISMEFALKRLMELRFSTHSMIMLLAPVVLCSLVLFAPTPAAIQHGLTICVAGMAAIRFIFMAIDPVLLANVYGTGNAPTDTDWNVARWHFASYLGMAIVNEILIANTAPHDWIIVYPIIAIVFHYLFWWAVVVTYPNREDF